MMVIVGGEVENDKAAGRVGERGWHAKRSFSIKISKLIIHF